LRKQTKEGRLLVGEYLHELRTTKLDANTRCRGTLAEKAAAVLGSVKSEWKVRLRATKYDFVYWASL